MVEIKCFYKFCFIIVGSPYLHAKDTSQIVIIDSKIMTETELRNGFRSIPQKRAHDAPEEENGDEKNEKV